METLGDRLAVLCANSQHEVLLVAPFVKVKALQQVIQRVDPSVKVICVTRWRPDEIAAGVSDLEVWPFLRDRPNSTLHLRADLHAKYYRSDGDCLIGSANLTATALGWTSQPNFELLVSLKADDASLCGFENGLMAGAVPVDEAIYRHMQDVVRLIPAPKPIHMPNPIQIGDIGKATPISLVAWLPSLRVPEQLFEVYRGILENVTTASREAAQADLAILMPPSDLEKEAFNAYIGAMLLQMPIVQKVDDFAKTPQRFGAVSALLRTLPCAAMPGFDSDRAWQTLMRWLIHFIGKRYEITQPNYSEIFRRNPISLVQATE